MVADEGGRLIREGSIQPLSAGARAVIANALATLDGEHVADALAAAVESVLSPRLMAGFEINDDRSIEMRQFKVDPIWDSTGIVPDFGWLEELLVPDVRNGASLTGPPLNGATQIAAVMRVDDRRLGCLVIAGDYQNVELARQRLADIARQAGVSSQALKRSNERAADVAARRERERLSRDLHDSLSQSLWSLSMLSETADSMIAPDDPLHAVIRQIAEISLTSQEEMRALLINLRSAEPSRETIAGVLELLAEEFRQSNNVEVVASIADVDLDAETVMALRRIAEEALNNISRHARASSVLIVLDAQPVLTLRIADDGEGFDPKPLKGHLGTRIMAERAEQIGFDFDLTSVPGLGTIVSASADLSAAPPLPIKLPEPKQPSKQRALLFASCGLLMMALALASLFVGRSYDQSARQAQDDLEALTVLHASIESRQASADEASARILQGVSQATTNDVARAVADRSAAIADSRRRVEPIADPDTLAGQYALQVLDSLAGANALVPGGRRLDQLYTDVDESFGPTAQAGVEATTPLHSLGSLSRFDDVLTFSLLESVVARYAMDPALYTPPSSVRVFFEEYAEVIRGRAGFFGPEASMPFSNGDMPTSGAVVHEREAVAEFNRIVVDQQLWADDLWLREWTEKSGPPPTDLASYVERMQSAIDEGRAVLSERFEARRSLLADHRESDRYRSQLGRLAAGLCAAIGLAFVVLVVAAKRRQRLVAEANRLVDPLTGLGNRESLDTVVVPLLADPMHTHHALITLDLDRFRFLSDVHGQAFGDRMLQVVGIGLDNLVHMRSTVEGSVLRIDHDEFLVSLHSGSPIPDLLTDVAMRRIRSSLLSAPDGTLVRCGFSFGVVHAEGSPELEPLMTACNLAMCEDKARLDSSQTKA